MIKFYTHPKCSTCQKARQALDAKGIDYQEIDLVVNPPPKILIEAILKTGDYQLKDLFNHHGQLYRQLNMKQKIKTLERTELIELLSGHGMLVKRPLVTDGTRHTVGFRPPLFLRTWAQPHR